MNYGDTYQDTTDGEVLMFVADNDLRPSIWIMLADGSRLRTPTDDHPLVTSDTPEDTPEDWEKLS